MTEKTLKEKAKKVWEEKTKGFEVMSTANKDWFQEFVGQYIDIALQEQAKQKKQKIQDILGMKTNPTDRLFKISNEITKWVARNE